MSFRALSGAYQKFFRRRGMIMETASGFAAHSSSSRIDVDLRQVIYALSEALDLVGVDDVGHGKRVGLMATDCARALGRDETEVDFLFDLGMLHDIGVSSTAAHYHLLREFDWEGSSEHCVTGHARLSEIKPLAHLADAVAHHHTRWDYLAARSDLSPRTAEQANLIFLVDRVDALAAPYYAHGVYLMHIPTIRQTIRELAGRYFAPALVEAFLTASARESFWLQLEPRNIQEKLDLMLGKASSSRAGGADVLQIATVFARIVDAKSHFTANHSEGVARLAQLLADRLGIIGEHAEKLKIAGLLHDLGKLRIPDDILDKPGALDQREREIINTHSFETFRILRHIKGFDEITPWAAYHHEQPDGSGYPFHLHGDQLCFEARIIRVADIFQAMTQDRPYRRGSPAPVVLHHLHKLADRHSVDRRVVDAAESDLDSCFAAAYAPG